MTRQSATLFAKALKPPRGRKALFGSLGHRAVGRVGAEGLLVVEVLIADGEDDDPLSEHGLLVVDDSGKPARVGNGLVEDVEESESLADLAKQEDVGVGGEPSPPP
ncbi:hypothetical protein SAMN05444166_2632 [Singulisphaera sp. GP187]|nr:hypothetical protein [Singulisphaera sp. GP187]SIO13396.1 hypothetical protein SAMN05444166_2632 [Singulisphaera sp. GP187]